MASLNHPKGNRAVFGLFDERFEMEKAITQLEAEGFRASDVSVLFADKVDGAKMAHDNTTKAPEGATAGAATGVAIGGVLGWLAGIGAMAIPGVGPLIAAGPIMAAIAGAGLGGTVGGVTGGLVGFGIPEYEAKRYETFVREGGYLISVHVDDGEWLKKAERILQDAGAKSVSAKGEKAEPEVSTAKERAVTTPPTDRSY